MDEVEERAERALVLARDHDDETQVAGDESVCGGDVVLALEADGEVMLLLAREQRVAADLREVALQGIERNERARRLAVVGGARRQLGHGSGEIESRGASAVSRRRRAGGGSDVEVRRVDGDRRRGVGFGLDGESLGVFRVGLCSRVSIRSGSVLAIARGARTRH